MLVGHDLTRGKSHFFRGPRPERPSGDDHEVVGPDEGLAVDDDLGAPPPDFVAA